MFFAVFLFILDALRAETAAAGDEVHVLMLLGATRGFVAMPHILFGVYSCAVGLVLGAGYVNCWVLPCKTACRVAGDCSYDIYGA